MRLAAPEVRLCPLYGREGISTFDPGRTFRTSAFILPNQDLGQPALGPAHSRMDEARVLPPLPWGHRSSDG